MKSYRYAELYITLENGVSLHSTDSQLLDWILAELKKVKTGFRVSADKLPSGEEYSLRIYQLGSKDFQIGWWILKQLCLQGWEPFVVNYASPRAFVYHFRLEGNAK